MSANETDTQRPSEKPPPASPGPQPATTETNVPLPEYVQNDWKPTRGATRVVVPSGIKSES
jgi:hypothetical protein